MWASLGSLWLCFLNIYVWCCVCSAVVFVTLLMISKIEFPIAEINFYSRGLLIFFTLAAAFGMLMPVFILRPGNVSNLRIYGCFITWILTLINLITFEIRSSEYLKVNQGAILVSNHQTVFDLLAMLCVAGKVSTKLICSPKQELMAKLPWPFQLLFGVKAHSLDNYKTKLLNENIQLWSSSKLQPLKKGPFNLAVHAQVPIVPLVVSPFHFIDGKYCLFAKGHIILKVLEPISTNGLLKSDLDKLMDRVQVKMQAEYQSLKKECLHHAIDREWQARPRPILTITC